MKLKDNLSLQYYKFDKPVSEFKLTIGGIYKGTKWNDTCLSKVTAK